MIDREMDNIKKKNTTSAFFFKTFKGVTID